MTEHIFGMLSNAWWGGIAILAIVRGYDAIVHVGNALMHRANVEDKKFKASTK